MIKALLLAMPDRVPYYDDTSLPNLGLVSLAGNVDPGVCDVKVADLLLIKKHPEAFVRDVLQKRSPDLVGLSCMSFQYYHALKLAKLVKTYDKNILTVIGGYHPTLMHDEMTASSESQFMDFIIRGEGEATFSELITAIDSGSGYDKIPGLSYKVNGAFHHNPPRDLLPVSAIQLPKRDARLIKDEFYGLGMPADSVETSRGCTYSCKFCSIKHMYGRSFRTYEISRVISDIKDAREHGARMIGFVDDNVTLDPERLERLCEEIIAARLNSLHYSVQGSVKGIAHSAKLVQKMADAGIKLVFLGIESVSKTHLDFLRKKSTVPDDVRKAVGHLRDNGIICQGGFILGNPDDDEESLWDAFDAAKDLKIDLPAFFVLTPHMKTEIREELMAEGLVINPDDLSSYHGFSSNIKTRHLSPEQIDRIMGEMYYKYYWSPSYVKFSQVRKTYPRYFWTTAAKRLPSSVLDIMKKSLKRERGTRTEKKDSNPQIGIMICLFVLHVLLLFSSVSRASELVNLALHDEVYAFVKRLTAKNMIEKRLDTTRPLTHRAIAEALLEITQKHLAEQIELTDVESDHLQTFLMLFDDEMELLEPGITALTEKNHTIRIRHKGLLLTLDLEEKQEIAVLRSSFLESGKNTSITSSGITMYGKLKPNLGFSSIVRSRFLLGSDTYNPYQTEDSWRQKPPVTLSTAAVEGYAILDLPWGAIKWGLDKAWWGPGWHGALLISDNSAPRDNLEFAGSYGPIKYVYFTAVLRENSSKEYNPRYMSAHRLEFIPYQGISVGLSEIMVFADRYEVRYLNPFVFFHGMQAEDRKNNGLIGVDFDITLLPSVEFYGELMIDDLQTDEGVDFLRAWGSKYGLLMGGYWVDPLGMRDTNVRMEYCFVNQYAYTHKYRATSYTHRGFVIGHWIGTDADDLWFDIEYWLSNKLRVSMTYERERQGEGDASGSHRPLDSSEYWEFLSGIVESTNSLSVGLSYTSIGKHSAGIRYTYSRLRNADHEQGNDRKEHQLILIAEYRF